MPDVQDRATDAGNINPSMGNCAYSGAAQSLSLAQQPAWGGLGNSSGNSTLGVGLAQGPHRAQERDVIDCSAINAATAAEGVDDDEGRV